MKNTLASKLLGTAIYLLLVPVLCAIAILIESIKVLMRNLKDAFGMFVEIWRP